MRFCIEEKDVRNIFFNKLKICSRIVHRVGWVMTNWGFKMTKYDMLSLERKNKSMYFYIANCAN